MSSGTTPTGTPVNAHCYTADFLFGLLEGVDIPDDIGAGEFEDRTFEIRDGWKVVIFYDCGELDYIDHFETPDGTEVDFWEWPESADRTRLINWR